MVGSVGIFDPPPNENENENETNDGDPITGFEDRIIGADDSRLRTRYWIFLFFPSLDPEFEMHYIFEKSRENYTYVTRLILDRIRVIYSFLLSFCYVIFLPFFFFALISFFFNQCYPRNYHIARTN